VSYDWVSLLKSDLGVSELGFRALLFNRHDMRDSPDAAAGLDDGERRCVAALRRKFDANAVAAETAD